MARRRSYKGAILMARRRSYKGAILMARRRSYKGAILMARWQPEGKWGRRDTNRRLRSGRV